MKNDARTIRDATKQNKADFVALLKLDYARNERDSLGTPSESVYKACMARLRHLRIAIAHIEAGDLDAFNDCDMGPFIVANYHAETICPKHKESI